MTTEKLKALLDACFVAKHITESMAHLPKGMKPRHIHVIDAIYELKKYHNDVCVNDVSRYLDVTTPSITKLIHELLSMGVVTKSEATNDKRITLLGLTDKGLQYEKQYVTEYHAAWVENMTDITEEQANIAIHVITSLQKSIPEGGVQHE